MNLVTFCILDSVITTETGVTHSMIGDRRTNTCLADIADRNMLLDNQLDYSTVEILYLLATIITTNCNHAFMSSIHFIFSFLPLFISFIVF